MFSCSYHLPSSSGASYAGLTTPLLFSNLALDISPIRIKRLIDTFLRTCSNHRPGSTADIKWREEAQFAGPHELGMTLRWGLARIVRIFQGQETRGIITWETYLRWREDEGGTSPIVFSPRRPSDRFHLQAPSSHHNTSKHSCLPSPPKFKCFLLHYSPSSRASPHTPTHPVSRHPRSRPCSARSCSALALPLSRSTTHTVLTFAAHTRPNTCFSRSSALRTRQRRAL